MSEINFNFGGVKASTGFSIVPAGKYLARIDGVEVKETQPKNDVEQKASDGTPARYLNVKWVLLDEEHEGRFVWSIASIRFPTNPLDDTKKERTTREMFLSFLNTVTGTDWADTDQGVNLNNLVGSQAVLIITESEYQGNPKNEVKRVLDVSEASDTGSLESMRRTI